MKPSKTEKSVRVETETVLPGTELSTQASLGDYELKKAQATLPRTHTRRTGRTIATCSDQLSDREIASLYEQLAPLIGLARLLKGEPPGTPPASAATTQAISPSDATVMIRAYFNEIYRRIPLAADHDKDRGAEHCPVTGFNRSQIYDALKVREHGKLVVDRKVIGKKGQSRGVTLYRVGSLLRYVESLPEAMKKTTGD